MNRSCIYCDKPAVCFSTDAYYCIEHLPEIQNNIIAPIDNRRYAQAIDLPDILLRIERLERIVAEWTNDV